MPAHIISEYLLKRLIVFLKDVAEVHAFDEYGKHFADCEACVASRLIEQLGWETQSTTW